MLNSLLRFFGEDTDTNELGNCVRCGGHHPGKPCGSPPDEYDPYTQKKSTVTLYSETGSSVRTWVAKGVEIMHDRTLRITLVNGKRILVTGTTVAEEVPG